MKKRSVAPVLLFGILFFSSLILAEELNDKQWHLTLLAVKDNGVGYEGSIADLYLELKSGSGRVFLETFPLTKMDTQISTRFAKDIACNYFSLNCNKYDYIYTIKASSNIIGGPSAGAAIAALTSIAVLDLDYNEKITITGTINSGGIVGPVGGTKEKIEAASRNGVEKVMIALGSKEQPSENGTLDLVNYSSNKLGISVVEVSNLNEVVFHLTDKKLKKDSFSFEISPEYQKIMKELSDLLCQRTDELETELNTYSLNESETKEIEGKKNSSVSALENEDYYSAASFCFGANILLGELINKKQELTDIQIVSEAYKLSKKVNLMEDKLEKEEIETISDLQTMMVVKERLNEVKEKIIDLNESKNKEYTLAHAEERFFSAISWMYFFKMDGKEFVLDEIKLKDSCINKISESEERYQYVELIFGNYNIGDIKKKILLANKNLDEQEYGLCLIQAVQAKAEANAMLNVMGLSENNLDVFLNSKINSVEKVIAENSQEDVFPILGYSYYQYANSLKETEKHSALLFLEYALEMSDLDIYFEEGKDTSFISYIKLGLSKDEWVVFGVGLVIGFLTALVFIGLIKRKKVKYKTPARPEALLGKKR